MLILISISVVLSILLLGACIVLFRQWKETKNAYEDLEQVYRKFFSVVSHDIKNPIAALLLNCEMLDRLVKNEYTATGLQIKQRIVSLNRSAQRMKQIIDNVNDVQLIRNGSFKISKESWEISSIADEALEYLYQSIEERKIKVIISIQPNLPLVVCDRVRILQVLNNLIDNAVKYSPVSGEVQLTIEKSGPHVNFVISDQGPGVEENKLATFFKGIDETFIFQSKGNGLGLFISNKIISAHNGSIGVRSIPNQKTSFFFSLPIATTAVPVSGAA